MAKKGKQDFKRGISFVEMMIFMFFMVVLSLSIYSHLLSMFRKPRDAEVKSKMFTLQIAAENFATMTNGIYPEQCVMTVSTVLIAMGFPDTGNQFRIADACPGTGSTVVTTEYGLLPGKRTYYNHLFPLANCLDELIAHVAPGPAQPAHVYPTPPGASGSGTVYWGPIGVAGTTAMEGYVIYGDGYKESISLILRSGL